MERYIKVSDKARGDIMKAFHTGAMGLWRALHFKSDSDNSKRMRVFALRKGGVEMIEAPVWETIFTTSGVMRQEFPCGYVIEIDMKSGRGKVYSGDKDILTIENPTISELEKIQASIMELWNAER